MQRIESLIEKLKEQYLAKAPASQLLITIQMLQNEVSESMKETEVLGTTQIAVVMPNVHNIVIDEPVEKDKPKDNEPEKIYYELNISEEDLLDEDKLDYGQLMSEEKSAEDLSADNMPEKDVSAQIDNSTPPQQKATPLQVEFIFDDYKKQNFDPLSDVPTLSHQLMDSGDVTINDKITSGDSHLHGETGKIKDLKKAISINDKFMFINELFRGDEVMYERSIKTINNFSIYAEAEYWITRELKTKVGWDANNPTVEYFESLVKRRFSLSSQ